MEITEPGSELCYHYCDSGDIRTLDPTAIIRSWTRQVLEKMEITDALVGQVKKHILHGSSVQYREALELSLLSIKPLNKILIVLDAMDETSEGQRTVINRAIDILLEKHSETKIFLSCRRGDLRAETRHWCPYSVNITGEKVANDLQAYIRGSVEDACTNEYAAERLALRDPR